ncbi:MAG: NAD(P)-dependent oxidoreductase [Bryobacteraceae bacterium]
MENRVGLIGLGLLGSALAERFLLAGFAVSGFDTDPARLAAFAQLGGVPESSSAQAAAGAAFVVLSLPDSSVSATVIDDLVPALEPGAVVVDTTTGEPAAMADLGARVPRYVDATVAGSSRQVREGAAVVMAGGASADILRCTSLLECFAARIFHTGDCGSGARMKLIVNLVLGLNRAAVAEGLALAQASGVDPALALDVLRAGPAFSTAMDRKGPKMVQRDWTPEARLAQHHKDVRLILAEAGRAGIELPLSITHERLLEKAEQSGFGAADNAAILEAYSQ